MEILLGDKLTQLRNDADLKQIQLAKLINRSATTIHNIESGKRPISPALLSEILQFYKTHFHWTEKEYQAIHNECYKMLGQISRKQMNAMPSVQNVADRLIVCPDLDKAYLRVKWHEAKHSICILSTWAWTIDPLWTTLGDASKRGVNIQILLLDIELDTTKRRLLDLKYSADSPLPLVGLERIKHDIENGRWLADKTEVRLYNGLPPFALYTADNWGMMGIYWHDRFSAEGPHIELDDIATSLLGTHAMQTYNVLWNSASSYNI